MSPFLRVLIFLCAGYVLVAAVIFFTQRRLMYLPDPTPPSLAQAGVPDMSVVALRTGDGLDLEAWYRPAARDSAPTLVYLHGNAGNIGHRGGKVRPYLDAGFGVLLVSWRGYGGNPGRPTEQGLYEDARAAVAYLSAAGVATTQIVLYGESLGSGPAVHIAAEGDFGAVVLEAPFTSAGDLAQRHYWYLPARALLRDRYDSQSKIARIGAPLLILHGERDQVVPARFGRTLLAAARRPKDGAFFAAAGHNDLYEHGAAQSVIDFLGRVF
ncbi:MAG: alpha/beta hydrolase [Alphaproteobacteria bacterium]|nr:alpha/beta hydrolase [Alphaproteobacteria bacterium]